jgi:hypothetical protein
MSREKVERLDQQGMSARDTHNAEPFVGMFADDFACHDSAGTDHERGRGPGLLRAWMTAPPDMRLRQVSRVVGHDAVAAEAEYTGTGTGPMMMG